MTTYRVPPGAWLSGAALYPPIDLAGASVAARLAAGLYPDPHAAAAAQSAAWYPDPHRRALQLAAALYPDPHRAPLQLAAALYPDPHGPAATAPAGAGVPAVAAVQGGPWSGIDPAWVYAGGETALLAQALRKSRNRIVRADDPRRAARVHGRDATTLDPLWRWQPAFRRAAAAGDLLGSLAVEGLVVWWLPRPSQLGRSAACRVFELVAPGPEFDYADQLDKVLRAAVEREDRMPEILSQIDDVGVFFDAITGLPRAQAPRLAELLATAHEVATFVLMQLKNRVAEWRPAQRSGQIQPVITTPGHGSLPSGHATIGALESELLAALLYRGGRPDDAERRAQLDRLARRIAFNRVVAGVHFPMDSDAGYALGRQLAAVMQAAAAGAELPGFLRHEVGRTSELTELPPGDGVPAPTTQSGTSAAASEFAALWTAAASEVAQSRV